MCRSVGAHLFADSVIGPAMPFRPIDRSPFWTNDWTSIAKPLLDQVLGLLDPDAIVRGHWRAAIIS